MTPNRVLFIAQQIPYPPHAGGSLRVWGQLNGLHQAGYTLDLMTFSHPSHPSPSETPLHSLCSEIITLPPPVRTLRDRLRDLVSGREPDMARRFYTPAFARALEARLAAYPYGAVHICGLEMSPYLPHAKGRASRVVYDAYNAEYDLQRRIFQVDRGHPNRLPAAVYSFIQWRRLQRYEREVCLAADAVIAVSEADASLLGALAPTARISVVPNGIYTADYAPTATRQLDLGPGALLFTGTMDYRPNVDAALWFVDQVFGQIKQAAPETRLFLVGNRPHPRLATLRGRPDVEVTGYVQDVAPFLHSAAVYIAPLRMGSGTRLKLLQAMAAGCAIVATSTGAEGLHITPGREMLIADDAASFAAAVSGLLRDPARRAQIGAAAQAFVVANYDWARLIPRLLDVYREIGIGEPTRA